jgi:hypothetical protein
MLFDKTKDMTTIKEAITNAKIARFGPKEMWPANIESPVTDGDDPKHALKEGYKGHWVIRAKTGEDSAPGVVGPDLQPIINQADFYPGCYARAAVYAQVWEYGGKYGISFWLDHVQKTGDGKSFSSKKSVDQVFAPVAPTSAASDAPVSDDFM